MSESDQDPSGAQGRPQAADRAVDPAGQPGRNWARANARAIAERRAWIAAHGAPLADLQVLGTD